jgi:hypothetical protein
VFENKELRKVYGPKKNESYKQFSILKHHELSVLYESSTLRIVNSRTLTWVRHVARMGDTGDACRILMGKSPF